MKHNESNIKIWSQFKDSQYRKRGTLRRYKLDKEFETYKIDFLLRNARE
jgi:hypothetical protein